MNENKIDMFLHCIVDGEDKNSPLKNRIRKNYKHIRKWAKRTNTNCFRIYDREIRNYPLAIDYYAGHFCIHYFARRRENSEAPQSLVNEINGILIELFNVSKDNIFWRYRIKRSKFQQYEKNKAKKRFFDVLEYGINFKVNLEDYLDTGLFLDHRETRNMVAKLCHGKRVLNLFAYTCAFSVRAASAGAAFTKSVDMSNTYIAWGKRNFLLNKISLKNHNFVREDCLRFLDLEIAEGSQYDVIIVDPPTISRSKKMKQMFDIQIDYIDLLKKSLVLLKKEKGAVLFFSTNSRKFIFDPHQFVNEGVSIIEISKKTLPIDFHDPKIHRCWKFTR